MDDYGFKAIILVIVLVIYSVISMVYCYGTARTVEFTVDKLVEKNSPGSTVQEYLIMPAEEHLEIMKNTDCWWRLKFDSSDIRRDLSEGKKYRALVYGWRIHIFSLYPNIVSLKAL